MWRAVAEERRRAVVQPWRSAGAESADDFVHKMSICLKELKESRRWLRLIKRVPMLKPEDVDPLLAETEELIKIFASSIQTRRKAAVNAQSPC